ncbi:MAG TPA: hypothetical protein VMZ31_03140 [Phycisphaerae bacterium]|nr:hypothetical protein [Phycisphaerae bacterium]
MNRQGTGQLDVCKAWLGRVMRHVLDESARHNLALARHLAVCPQCASVADRLGRVTAALALLSNMGVPSSLLGKANVHALRMVRRQLRFSEQAAELASGRRRVPWSERLAVLGWRLASPVTAALLIVLVHTGVWQTMIQTREMGQRMADTHFRAHVYPPSEGSDGGSDVV